MLRPLALARSAALAALVSLAAFPPVARAAGTLVARESGPLEAVREEVSATVRDGLATTRVVEVFRNPSDAVLEAVYELTLPRGASVTDFTMWVDGKAVRGEVLDRDEARRAYESLVRRARDPGLLEQTGERTFRARVYPVSPRSEQRFEVEVFERLTCEAGTFRYVWPMAPAKGAAPAGPGAAVSFRLEARSAVPIRGLEAPGRSMEIKADGSRRAIAGWEGRAADVGGRDLEVRIHVGRDATGADLVAHRPEGAQAAYFAVALTPGEALAETILPKDVTFVIDTSGSMQGVKIEQARAALIAAIGALRDQDRFAVIRFSSAAEPWRPELVSATAVAKAQAYGFVATLAAEGSTAFAEALDLALAPEAAPGRPHLVLALTDGRPTTGETVPERVLAGVSRAAAARGARVFTFGVGDDLDEVLLRRIAEATSAVAESVAPDESIDAKVAALVRKVDAPVLSDVSLDLAALQAFDVSPRKLPDLFAGTQLLVTGRSKAAGKALVRLRGRVRGGAPVEVVEEVELPALREEDAEVGRLFAMRKVADLLDGRTGPLPSEVRAEVVDLGKRFRIATPYTSFFVPEPERQTSEAPRPRSRLDLPDVADRGVHASPVGPGDTTIFFPGAEGENHNESAGVDDDFSARGDSVDLPGAYGGARGGFQNRSVDDAIGVGGGGGGAGRYGTRFGGRRELVLRGGGSQATESAVAAGLRWLARHQSRDGSWRPDAACAACASATVTAAPGEPGLAVEATSLALLAFLGSGYTHHSRAAYEDPHDHRKVSFGAVVRTATAFIVAAQRADGGFGDPAAPDAAARDALATLAIVEAYGLTNAVLWRSPAQLGIDRLVAYASGGVTLSADAVAWSLGAFHGVPFAGLSAPGVAVERLVRMHPAPALPALDGDPLAFLASVPYTTTNGRRAAQNPLAKRLVERQRVGRDGCLDGSWERGAPFLGRRGGRVVATAAAALVLEDYYRYESVFGGEKRRR